LRLKTLVGAAISCAAIAISVLPAAAVGTVTVTPNSNLIDGQAVTVTWSGFTNPVFIAQCSKSITDRTFVPEQDCDFDTNGGVVGGPTSGTATVNIFKGDRPLLGWACGSSDTGLPVSNPCFIRVTDIGNTVLTNQIEAQITYAAGPVVPEVPYAVLLPMGAIAALGAGYFLNRRRLTSAA